MPAGPPLSKLGLKQGRLNPLIWLTVITLSFLPAAYFFKDTWLVYVLVGLPLLAFTVTLMIGWYWAICKPDMLLSEEIEALARLLANSIQTNRGPIPAGEFMSNPLPPEEPKSSEQEN